MPGDRVDRRILEDLVEPFAGRVYCHVPAGVPFRIDVLARRDDGRDRWGVAGHRTVDLAGDPGVALAELARHRERGAPADERTIVRLRLQAVTVLDLRRRDVADALGLRPGFGELVDRAGARRLSARIRATSVCHGILVPSMAFLDRSDRHNVVLFCEALRGDLDTILCDPEPVGRVRIAG